MFDNQTIIILLISMIVIIGVTILENKKRGQKERKKTIDVNPNEYKSKFILTPNEKSQYNYLKIIIQKLELTLFVKVRLADIVEPTTSNYAAFNKIKSKHVDFIVCLNCNSKLDTFLE